MPFSKRTLEQQDYPFANCTRSIALSQSLPCRTCPASRYLIDLVPRILNPQIAVIILSRLNFQTLAELALLNGAQAYLVKSRISGDDLDSTIHKALATVASNHKERCV